MWLWYCNLLKVVPLQSTFGFSIKSLFAFFGHVLRLLTKIQKVTARFYFSGQKLHSLKVSWWKNYPPRACIIIWNMFVVCIEYILYLATGTYPKRARKYGEPSNSNCYYALFENVKSSIKWLIFFFRFICSIWLVYKNIARLHPWNKINVGWKRYQIVLGIALITEDEGN